MLNRRVLSITIIISSFFFIYCILNLENSYAQMACQDCHQTGFGSNRWKAPDGTVYDKGGLYGPFDKIGCAGACEGHDKERNPGSGCTSGSTFPCIDSYLCQGTQSCSNSKWGNCIASEYNNNICQGTATSCSAISTSNCPNQQGCSVMSHCTGVAIGACNGIDQPSCQSVPGCSWQNVCSGKGDSRTCSYQCAGYPTQCVGYADGPSCNGRQGCSFTNYCGGTETPCSSLTSSCKNSAGLFQQGCYNCGMPGNVSAPCNNFYDSTSCQQQQGCSWGINGTYCTGTNTFNCAQYSIAQCPSDSRCQLTGGYNCNCRSVCSEGENRVSCHTVCDTCYTGCGPAQCASFNNSQTTCLSATGCSYFTTTGCIGTAATCNSIQDFSASCNNTLNYIQKGCSPTSSIQCATGICGPTETQASNPTDCPTIVKIIPSSGTIASQQVIISISFNDSRYKAGNNTYFNLTIDGIQWNSTNGCSIAYLNVTPVANGINTLCTWNGASNPCNSTSVKGYLSVTTNCSLPSSISSGSHLLTAIPTFFSSPGTTVNGGSATFNLVSDTSTVVKMFDGFYVWLLSSSR